MERAADKDVLEYVIGTQMALSVSRIVVVPIQYAFTWCASAVCKSSLRSGTLALFTGSLGWADCSQLRAQDGYIYPGVTHMTKLRFKIFRLQSLAWRRSSLSWTFHPMHPSSMLLQFTLVVISNHFQSSPSCLASICRLLRKLILSVHDFLLHFLFNNITRWGI